MGTKATPFKRCTTVEEIRSNIIAFPEGWETSHERMKKLIKILKLGSYWLYDRSSGGFANAKFVGYKGMTAKKYTKALNQDRLGTLVGPFSGNVNRHISKLLSKEWNSNTELSVLLSKFAVELGGHEVMEGVDRDKWKFIELDPIQSSDDTPTRKRKLRADLDQLPLGDPDYHAEITGREGGKRVVTHVRTERAHHLPLSVKKEWRKKNPDLECLVCGFSFLRTYGKELGDGFVEAHHRELLSGRQAESATAFTDFDPVCSNCHRMLHKMENMCSDELRRIVEANRE